MEDKVKRRMEISFSRPFESYRDTAVKNLDLYVSGNGVSAPNTILRDRQITVFEDIRDFVKSGGLEGYVALPTATGKTPLYIKFMEAIIGGTDMKAIIVVPTNVLVNQTEKMLYKFIDREKIGSLPSKIGILNYLHKDYNSTILITTYASLRLNTESGAIDPKECQVLILDEAHEVITEKRKETLDKFTNSFKLGLTATPEYSEEKKLINILPNEIHRMSIREAVYEGLLSDFSVYIVDTKTDLTNVKVSATGEYDERDLDLAINTKKRNLAVLDVYQNMFPGMSAIANCASIGQAVKLAEMANRSGIPAVAVHSSLSEKERDEAVWKFKSGDAKLITNVDILTRGFDAPNAAVCLNVAPTLSKVRATQRPGRVLRRDPEEYEKDYAGKHAYIIDFIDYTENRRAVPISFAEIAEDAEIVRSQATYHMARDIRRSHRSTADLEVKGINVVTEPHLVMRVVNERKAQRLKEAPEEYIDKDGLKLILDISNKRLNTMMLRHQGELVKNPGWVGEYLDKAGRPALFYHKDFVAILKETAGSSKPAPEGWKNRNGMRSGTGRSFDVLNAIIKSHSKELEAHPEWIRVFLDTAKKPTTFFHPDFVKIIEKDAESIKSPPEGWMSAKGIGDGNPRNQKTISKVISSHAEDLKRHPEWSGVFLPKTGGATTFYHPDFVKIVREDATKIRPAPDGWKNMSEMTRSSGKDRSKIEAVVKSHGKTLEAHPDWSGTYLTKRGFPIVFYHPDFAKLVIEDATQIKLAPEGWKNESSLADDAGISAQLMRKVIALHNAKLKAHPEWKGVFQPKTGKPTVFYHPDFVAILKTEAQEFKPAPEGWKTNKNIGAYLGKDPKAIRRQISEHAKDLELHPEWIGLFMSSGVVTTFYHPDFVELIRKEM